MNKLEGLTVLVTGGTGFIGGRLIEKLVLEGRASGRPPHVRVLIRNFGTASRLARFPVEMIGGDIQDEETVQQAVEGCDIVFHCAALIVVPESVSDPHTYYRENVSKSLETIKTLLDLGMRDFIFSSSASIYQPEGEFQVDETSPTGAKSPYAYTKIALEHVFERLQVGKAW